MSEEELGEQYVSSYASAVMPVLAWVYSQEWVGAYQAHFGEFFSELGNMVASPDEDVLGELPTAFWARAARCCFDDFLTVYMTRSRVTLSISTSMKSE